jgi:hypothetical protein
MSITSVGEFNHTFFGPEHDAFISNVIQALAVVLAVAISVKINCNKVFAKQV